jgi:hypothetical protein
VPTFADRGLTRGRRGGSHRPLRPERLLFLTSSSSFILTRAEWAPFQTHCYSENLVAPGVEPGTLGTVARNSDHICWIRCEIISALLFDTTAWRVVGKVAGSRPDEMIKFYQFRPHYALGFTQPVPEMSPTEPVNPCLAIMIRVHVLHSLKPSLPQFMT